MTALSPCAAPANQAPPCTSLRSFYGFDRVPPIELGRMLPAEVERKAKSNDPAQKLTGSNVSDLGVADGVGDEPDHEPDQYHREPSSVSASG